jgi:hypothetical protein
MSCGEYCESCREPVTQDKNGRWFITRGHAGWAGRVNLKDGYENKQKALNAYNRFRGRK